MNRHAIALVVSAALLAGCAPKTRAAIVPTPMPLVAATAEAPEPVVEPEPEEVVEVGPADWRTTNPSIADAALAQIGVPDGCDGRVEDDVLSIECDGRSFQVRPTDRASLQGEVDRVLETFRQAGARAVMMGSPTCRIGADTVECSFVQGRGDSGSVGTAYVAVGSDGDRAFAVRCLYLGPDREVEFHDPVCRALLDVG